jgi:hypothetical protein
VSAAALTEKEWMRQVVDLAHLLGWATYHPLVSMKSPAGWPDLVLVRDRVLFVECKAERGVLSRHQERWRDRFLTAGAEWYLWKPADLEQVAAVLRRRVVV